LFKIVSFLSLTVFKFGQNFIPMHEDLVVLGNSKEEKYQSLIAPLRELLGFETDFIANMANLSAVLKDTFHFLWVGFYLVKGDSLVLGPFQGSLACTRIGYGLGVCGTAWKEKKAQLVDDVDLFPGHIACSSLSRSEIVIPLVNQKEVWAVLDVDSEELAHFDSTDLQYLGEIVQMIQKDGSIADRI
jgi:GAF domain-containing protein